MSGTLGVQLNHEYFSHAARCNLVYGGTPLHAAVTNGKYESQEDGVHVGMLHGY